MTELSTTKKITIVFSTIFTMMLILCGYWIYRGLYPQTDDAYIQANIVRPATQISGVVSKVYVQNQQYVQKGQPILDIDDASFLIAKRRQLANLEIAIQNHMANEASVKSAKAKILQAQANLDFIEKESKRILSLVHSKQLPPTTGDEEISKLESARANLQDATQQWQAAMAKQGQIDAQQNAEIKAEKAALDQAELNLSYTHITAPTSGQIVNFTLRNGTLVSIGTPLYGLIESNHYWVDANFKETDLNRIRPNQSANIEVDMYPGVTFSGKVVSICQGSGSIFSLFPPENATGNWVKVTQRFPVRIEITEMKEPYPLRVGSSSTVTINTHS